MRPLVSRILALGGAAGLLVVAGRAAVSAQIELAEAQDQFRLAASSGTDHTPCRQLLRAALTSNLYHGA